MKTGKEILEMYGTCCVSEHNLTNNMVYEDGEKGKARMRKDDVKIENIRGQKLLIEWMFE